MSEITSPGSDNDARATVRRLLEVGAAPRPDVDRAILDRGAAAVPALIEILEDRALGLESSPGAGYAPVHAARLLGAIGAPDAIVAIEPLLRAIVDTDELDSITDDVLTALPAFGAPVIEPALRAYAASADPVYRARIASVLAALGIQDERIFPILAEQVRADPNRADYLGSYGDPRGLPVLLEALDRFQVVEGDNPFANHALVELRAAIEMLDGTLTEAQQRKIARGGAAADRFRRTLSGFQAAGGVPSLSPFLPPPPTITPVPRALRPDRPGRNEPCWCGSGKKYKKCHLAEDEGGGAG